MQTPAPLLVIGWGNPSRGDDALGPLLVQALATAPDARWLHRVDFLEDHQLQVEHVLDLAGRQRVLFVDASVDAAAPFEVSAVQAAPPGALASHALTPQALLQVYRQVHASDAPPCTLLALRGAGFELGAPLSVAAQGHLAAALRWAREWMAQAADTTGTG